MILPRTKEREYRFKLALRMGLPIFALILALISSTLITTYENLQPSFYIGSTILLVFSIYFIFYLIYRGFDVRITEPISKTFTRGYLYKYLKKDIKNNDDYTLLLVRIDNLNDINTRYGIKNGDKVLYETAKYISEYFEDKGIHNFPMGQVKGGDFVLGMGGRKENYNSIIELFYLKISGFKVDDIEVNISGALTDTAYSENLEYMIENLFELAEENKNKKIVKNKKQIKPNELESYVINAVRSNSLILAAQEVYENGNCSIKECFAKLKTSDGKVLHPKDYMKIINRLGLTAEYDLMMLKKSMLNCNSSENILFAIAISPTSLRDDSFLTKAKDFLNENAHLKGKIVLILSEIEYYTPIQRYNTILQSLRCLGIKIAVDRLGSLHTSFLYLRDLEVDIVRFDSFYTKDISNKNHNSIIEGLNVMAHSRGVKTWIKMVENKEMKELAKDIGIDYIQGKYIASLENINKDL